MSQKNKGEEHAADGAKRAKLNIERKVDDGNKCTWHLQEGVNPHLAEPPKPRPLICDTILDHIGNTPLVRINRIGKELGIECEILAKCEFFNAGGSVKDRIGKKMVEDAEKQGRIKPGDTLIEPTSGNTGIGLALAAAVKGYRMIITLPEKMSKEKVDVLKGLGAEIIRTPTEAAWDSPDSHIGVAQRLNREIKNSHILDQYNNPSNPLAHYLGTGDEIVKQCGGKIDAVVMTAGTGGTITGIARRIKEAIPTCKIIGVDPEGSILALPDSLNGPISSYAVEGIGYDFIPKVLDRNVVDEWVKSRDRESLLMARRLIREEGLLCGGSSGAAMWGALEVAKRFKKGQRVVVLLPDSVRNYMTKFLDYDWLVERGFAEPDVNPTEEWLHHKTVADLKLQTPLTVLPSVSCEKCVVILMENSFDQLPVVSAEGHILGMVTLGNLKSQLISGRVKKTDPISNVVYKQLRRVSLDTKLSVLSRIFDKDHFALVTTSQRCHTDTKTFVDKELCFGVVTPIDLVNYIISRQPAHSPAPQPTEH